MWSWADPLEVISKKKNKGIEQLMARKTMQCFKQSAGSKARFRRGEPAVASERRGDENVAQNSLSQNSAVIALPFKQQTTNQPKKVVLQYNGKKRGQNFTAFEHISQLSHTHTHTSWNVDRWLRQQIWRNLIGQGEGFLCALLRHRHRRDDVRPPAALHQGLPSGKEMREASDPAVAGPPPQEQQPGVKDPVHHRDCIFEVLCQSQ